MCMGNLAGSSSSVYQVSLIETISGHRKEIAINQSRFLLVLEYAMLRRIAVLCLLATLLVDIKSSARAASWLDGGSDKLWSTSNNWQFGNDPYNSPVTIGNHIDAKNDTTLVDQFYEVDSLTLSNGADVVLSPDGGTTSFAMQVHGNVLIGGAVDTSDSILTLYDAPGQGGVSFSAETMTIANYGRVKLDSINAASSELAILEITDGLLDNIAGNTGGISGNGLILLSDNLGVFPTTLLNNDGFITAGYVNGSILGTPPPATTLQITATDFAARFDWDGFFDAGTLQVYGNATLDIDVQPGEGISSDAFDGFMNLSTGSTIDIAHAWTFGKSSGTGTGEMNINTASFALVGPGQDPSPGPAAHIAGANWTMVGGTMNISDEWDTLQLDSEVSASGGTIENSGTIIFNANASFQSAVDFNMNGGGASLIVNAGVNIATPDFDLDGEGQPGNVTTINSGGVLNLGLGAGADEDFNHTINLNGGHLQVTTADNSWSLQLSGKINAGGGGNSKITGETLYVRGKIMVHDNSLLVVGADSVYSGSTNVIIEAGSTLDHSTVTYNGGSYTGGGVFKKGDATINNHTTWDVDTVDLDDGTTTLNANLTINADSIDDMGGGMGSTITIDDTSTLTVNVTGGSWTVDFPGSIVYNGGAISEAFLQGSDVILNGEMEIHGDGRTYAVLNIGSTGVINIASAGNFRLSSGDSTTHINTIAGGTINGPGAFHADTQAALHGFGTINSDLHFHFSHNSLIAKNGTLTLNGAILGVGTLGTSGATAVLNVTNPWNTNVINSTFLQDGLLQGATIMNDGNNGIDGFGEVTAQVINNTRISANGGTMIYNNKTNDWDGATNTGQIIADNGNVELQDTSAFLFNGTVQANSGREVFTNGFALEFSPSSNLNLMGGTYRSTHSTEFGGALNVGAGNDSTLQISGTATIGNGSVINLTGNLLLQSPETVVQQGATFAGGGALINTADRTLRILDGADVDALLENSGTLALGNSPGQTTGLDFQQNASGVWDLEIGGLGLNDFDRMNLTGLASLDGTLDLSLILGFTPTLGDTFNILSASGGVAGMFSSVIQPETLSDDLMFDVNYLGSIVQLEVIGVPMFTADFDNDGDVDADDLTQWQDNFGGPGSDADADADGDSDGVDFLAWQRQLGSGVSALASSNTVPEPSTFLLICLAACFGLLIQGHSDSFPRRKANKNSYRI